MEPVFPSGEWAARLCAAANEDEYLQEIGRGLNEDIEVIVLDAPGRGVVRLLFRVRDGRCVEARELAGSEDVEATIALEADYDTWRRMLRWELSPTMAVFRGKLRIKRGSLRKLLSRPIAHYQLYYLASNLERGGGDGA